MSKSSSSQELSKMDSISLAGKESPGVGSAEAEIDDLIFGAGSSEKRGSSLMPESVDQNDLSSADITLKEIDDVLNAEENETEKGGEQTHFVASPATDRKTGNDGSFNGPQSLMAEEQTESSASHDEETAQSSFANVVPMAKLQSGAAAASSVFKTGWGKASNVWAKVAATEAFKSASTTASTGWQKTREQANAAAERVKSTDAYKKASETSASAWEGAKIGAATASTKVKENAAVASEKMKPYTDKALASASAGFEKAKVTAQVGYEKARGSMGSGAEGQSFRTPSDTSPGVQGTPSPQFSTEGADKNVQKDTL